MKLILTLNQKNLFNLIVQNLTISQDIPFLKSHRGIYANLQGPIFEFENKIQKPINAKSSYHRLLLFGSVNINILIFSLMNNILTRS